MRIFIPGNCPSSKSGKVATSRGTFNNKTVRHYLQKLGVKNYSVSKRTVEGYVKRPNRFEILVAGPMRNYMAGFEYPALIGFHFIRDSRRRFDFNNVSQIICDLLVAHRVIPDDCMDYLIPFPLQKDGEWYSYDPKNPGVILEVK